MLKQRIIKLGAAVFLAVYAGWMLWLLFGQRTPPEGPYWENVASSCSFIPFRTIGEFLEYFRKPMDDGVQIAIVQLLGNIVMFIPLGFLPPFLLPKLRCLGKNLLFTVVIIVLIELLQLFTLLGRCDVDDLILNTVGTMLGYALFSAIPARFIP